jgi:phage terminase large subunit-like protein
VGVRGGVVFAGGALSCGAAAVGAREADGVTTATRSANWGGRRDGAGAKPLTPSERLERQQAREHEARELVDATVERLVARVGLPPRRRLIAGEDVKERTDGGWLAAFCKELCIQSIGRWSGRPLVFYPQQRAFFDDALAFDDEGARLYSMALWEIARKNGKTCSLSGLATAYTSPAEGEGKPITALAAGSAKQAGELFTTATDFIGKNELLRALFITTRDGIECPANSGLIERIAADGKLNHGRNDYLTAADELHAWLTPKHRENWAALTTSDGARDDALLVAISTPGYDLTSILGVLHTQAKESPFYEPHPEMGGAGFIVRDPDARLLVHCFAVAPGTPLTDLDEFKRANPAPWRTKERIARDLKKPIDEPTKRRLYGGEWTSARDTWIKREQWSDLSVGKLTVEDGAAIAVGVDASHSHDTTAVGWAWRLDDGRIGVRAKVFSVRKDAAAHCLFRGSKIRLSAVEAFVAASMLDVSLDDEEDALEQGTLGDGDLAGRFSLEYLGYDPRFFNRSAELLGDEDITVIPYEPTGTTMRQAVNDFYDDVVQGGIAHDGDPVLASHVDAASGEKVEGGWRVRRMKATRDIDGLIAVIIAADLARSQELGTATEPMVAWV